MSEHVDLSGLPMRPVERHAADASEQYLENMIHTLRVETASQFEAVREALEGLSNLLVVLGERVEQVDRNAHM